MTLLPYLLFISIFFLDFLHHELGFGPRVMTWIPELLSLLTLMLVLGRAVVFKSISIRPKYVFLVLFLFLFIAVGTLVNTVPPGAVVAGIRTYFRYVPFFLLPLVYNFEDRQMKTQLVFILGLSFLQIPIAIVQRFVLYPHLVTGDVVTGTLAGPVRLSIYLLCVISVIAGFYLKDKISLRKFVILIILLFLPMTINETKGTLVLLPIALAVPMLFMEGSRSQVIKKLAPVIAMASILIFGFVTVYNVFWENRDIRGFVAEGEFERYLYRGDSLREQENIGRFDSLESAFDVLSEDPIHLLVGLGIGNVSESFSSVLAGEYTAVYANLSPEMTLLGRLLWEIGIIGILLVLALFYFICPDRYQKT